MIRAHVERADGRLRSFLAVLDTGAAVSVFDGHLAVATLGFDPRHAAIDVISFGGLVRAARRPGYVHELRCYFGGYAQFVSLTLHVAFTDPDDEPVTFNVLGREGLHGAVDRGFFSQVQFGYRHRPPIGPPEVYLTFRP